MWLIGPDIKIQLYRANTVNIFGTSKSVRGLTFIERYRIDNLSHLYSKCKILKDKLKSLQIECETLKE